MREVVGDVPNNTVHVNDLDCRTPIFAVREGKVFGMIVQETQGWILRVGGDGWNGHHMTRNSLINSVLESDCNGKPITFAVDIKV